MRALKDADAEYFRLGDLELRLARPVPVTTVVQLPPGQTGIQGAKPTDESKLPPGYESLFPGGVNGLRPRPRGE